MIMVILIHVSDRWLKQFIGVVAAGGAVGELVNPIAAIAFNTFSRFAVPCFIMLSGAFVLADERTANYGEFYRKRLVKIGIPTLVFSAVYIGYTLICYVLDGASLFTFINYAAEVAGGTTYHHMWYMTMLIGLYLLAPIAVRFKDSISYKNFRRVVIVFFIMANVSRWATQRVSLSWNVGQTFEYLGYFMMGYVIRKDAKKSNSKGVFAIGLGLLAEAITVVAVYKLQLCAGASENDLRFSIIAPYTPPITLASVLIFGGFSMLKIKPARLTTWLSNMSFTIYLAHAIVWNLIQRAVLKPFVGTDFVLDMNCLYWIPIFTVIVMLLSILIALAYNAVYKRVYPKVQAKIQK